MASVGPLSQPNTGITRSLEEDVPGAAGTAVAPTSHNNDTPTVLEVSGTPGVNAQDSDNQLSLRPPFIRQDSARSVITVQTATVSNGPIGDKKDVAEKSDIEGGKPTDEATSCPPAGSSEVSQIALQESKGLRRLRMGSAFITLFLAGWNGGSVGALLPYIERTYNINYTQVSVLFVCTFLGYAVAAVTAGTLARKAGFGRALFISTLVEMVGNIINSSQQVNFGLMCFGFWVVGVAFATQLGLCNAYFATLNKPLMWTGILHGIYGMGAFVSPLIATVMVTKGVPFHLFYTTNLGMNVPVAAMAWLAFRDLDTLPQHPSEKPMEENVTPHGLRATLRSRAVWTLAIFLMLYVGAEESIGGWIISYILEVRKGTPEGASWVASCFYLGIALGRIFLPPLNMLMGERRSVMIYLAFAIALECVAWFVPVLASTAVCTALVGLAISTFYTAAITTGAKLVPRNMHADAFALMSSVGQSGSAFWPLVVGVMSTKKGIWVVEPTVVALLGAQGICWMLVPRVGRRAE